MKGSKLIELLKTFSARELRLFGDFLASPFFNKQPELISFYAYLKSCAPAFSDKKIKSTKVWKKAYPDKKFDEKTIGYYMSWTLKYAEQFLGTMHFQSQPFTEQHHILEACRIRGLDKHYSLVKKGVERELAEIQGQSSEYYDWRFHLALTEMEFLGRSRTSAHHESIQDAGDHLDIYYILTKLNLSCSYLNDQRFLNSSLDLPMIAELKELIRKYDFEKIPAISIYYQVLSMLTEEKSDKHFLALSEQLKNNLQVLPRTEAHQIYVHLQNYCIGKIKRGESQYLKSLFDIYKEQMDSKMLWPQKYLSPWNFKNIVSVALQLKEYDWTQKFIEEYKEFLSPEYRDTAFIYNLANLYYHLRQYDKALRALIQVEFTDVFYSLDTRRIMLKIYYEQEDLEPLFSLVASFRVYLRRNKLLSEGNRKGYANFVAFVNQLAKVREGDGERLLKMKGEMSQTQPLVDEQWLLEMIDRKADVGMSA